MISQELRDQLRDMNPKSCHGRDLAAHPSVSPEPTVAATGVPSRWRWSHLGEVHCLPAQVLPLAADTEPKKSWPGAPQGSAQLANACPRCQARWKPVCASFPSAQEGVPSFPPRFTGLGILQTRRDDSGKKRSLSKRTSQWVTEEVLQVKRGYLLGRRNKATQ